MKKFSVIYDFMTLISIFFIASWGLYFGYEIKVVYTSLLGLCFLAVVPWWLIFMSDLNKLL